MSTPNRKETETIYNIMIHPIICSAPYTSYSQKTSVITQNAVQLSAGNQPQYIFLLPPGLTYCTCQVMHSMLSKSCNTYKPLRSLT